MSSTSQSEEAGPSTSHNVVTVAVETSAGKKLCLEEPQSNDISEVADPSNYTFDLDTPNNVSFILLFCIFAT